MCLILPIYLIICYFLAQLIIWALLMFLKFIGVQTGNFNQTILSTIIDVIIYVITIILFSLPSIFSSEKIKASDVGFSRSMTWSDILNSIGGVVVYFILSAGLVLLFSQFIPGLSDNVNQDTGFDNLNLRYEYILAFITLVVIAPVAEEVLFRGMLFSKLKKYISKYLAIFIVSLTFGLLHWSLAVGIDTFALSLVLCTLREITGNLWASILLHMIKNGLAFFILFIYPLILTTLG